MQASKLVSSTAIIPGCQSYEVIAESLPLRKLREARPVGPLPLEELSKLQPINKACIPCIRTVLHVDLSQPPLCASLAATQLFTDDAKP